LGKLVRICQYNTDVFNAVFGLERQTQDTEKLKIFLEKNHTSTDIFHWTHETTTTTTTTPLLLLLHDRPNVICVTTYTSLYKPQISLIQWIPHEHFHVLAHIFCKLFFLSKAPTAISILLDNVQVALAEHRILPITILYNLILVLLQTQFDLVALNSKELAPLAAKICLGTSQSNNTIQKLTHTERFLWDLYHSWILTHKYQ